jgi:signal transduction histidine kinase/CheY-like chemotaxis protein
LNCTPCKNPPYKLISLPFLSFLPPLNCDMVAGAAIGSREQLIRIMSRSLSFSSWSLTTRITLGWLVITALLLFTFAWFSLSGSREYALTRAQTLLAHEIETAQVRIQTAVSDIASDALFLAQGPAVREFLASGDAAALQRVEAEFRALLSSKPSYFQVRLLTLETTGQELVRLDHLNATVSVIPKAQLQAKGDRDYFIESLPLAMGNIYLSDVNLNRDFGRITEPHIPTLRAATKAQAGNTGTPRGLIVINADLRNLFKSLTYSKNPSIHLSLANEAGDFVLHENEAWCFSSDLGTAHRFAAAPPSTSALQQEITFPFMPKHQRRAHLRATLPPAELESGIRQAGQKALGITLLGGLISLVLVMTFARVVAAKMHRLTTAVVEFQPGEKLPELPPLGTDEIGLLGAKFQAMAARVNEDLVRVDQARQTAEEAIQGRDDFLAMMSHEIRTPLNSVVGLLRTLERNRPSPHQQPILDAMGIATRQLLNLVNEALDHSKITAGKMEFNPIPFSLHSLLRDVSLTYAPQARQKGLDFELNLDETLPDWVLGDPTRLNQVIHNLLANALKFTDHGRISLQANALTPSGLDLSITDTGIGIAQENIGRLFKPFDQEHGEIARRFGGTGLGLALAQQMVTLQGGSLEVTSAGPNQGSTFTLKLPLPPAQAPAAQLASPAAVPNWSGRRLLYIEDVASNQEIMALLLADTGVTLETASTGAEGLQRWLQHPPDLVLLDLQLPDTDGLTLAGKALAQLPESRCLAVTAQFSAETRAACKAAGMVGYLSKPLDAPVVFAEIQRHLASGNTTSESLKTLFHDDPVRRQRVFAALGREFQHHQETLAKACSTKDVAALRALRHQLHTAISQFHLASLDRALAALMIDPTNESMQNQANTCLADTAQEFAVQSSQE